MNADWRAAAVADTGSIEDAAAAINASGLRIALVVDPAGTLLGTVSDGDLRRVLLRHVSVDAPVTSIMNRAPETAPLGTSRGALLVRMRRLGLLHIPLLDAQGRLAGLEVLDQAVSVRRRENRVLMMAGGYGRRLQPLTDHCPKPMLEVNGKPILQGLIEDLASHGFWRIGLAVHYKHEMIRAHFGDGRAFGVEITYIQEREPLGTAGALGLLPPGESAPILLMNADLLLLLDFGAFVDFHTRRAAALTMGVRQYEVQVPFGVVEADGEVVTSIVEKPLYVHSVNAGVYAVSPEAAALVSGAERVDLPDLVQTLLDRRAKVLRYPIHDLWLDVGRIDDLERARRIFAAR